MMGLVAQGLAAARQTLATKLVTQIELETAATWGARAVAAFELFTMTGDLRWRDQAVDYRHEAVEHAASAPPGAVEAISAEITQLTGGAL